MTVKRLRLTNTRTGKREEFQPLHPPKVTFYSCGPTVYGPLHIGNARQLIFADWVFRWLKHAGYDVNFVRNYTDVDDKIIDRASQEKTTSIEIADRYIDYCENDIRALKLLPPTKTVRVTETMPEIIAMIAKIIERGHAYVADGEVLFSIESFEGYGKLSGKKTEDLIAGARVEVDSKKRNPLDFALWKPWKNESAAEPFWESPWGKGRPGWHIECSAMSSRWLGETIDLHHGGQDLIFPHHENEIAQSEAASGKEFCRHWIHHAFLTSGNEKMSKSLGNIFTIRQFNTEFDPEVLKYMYLCFHFRSGVPFVKETLTQVLNELERVYSAKKWAEEAMRGPAAEEADSGENPGWQALLGRSKLCFERIEEEMSADLNTPGALGHLFTLIREINRAGTGAKAAKARSEVAKEFLSLLERKLVPLWNVFNEPSGEMLARIDGLRLKTREVFGPRSAQGAQGAQGAMIDPEDIERLIAERKAARSRKEFARADEIRKELDAKGIVLVDLPGGTTWKNKG